MVDDGMKRMRRVSERRRGIIGMLNVHCEQPVQAYCRDREKLLWGESGVGEEAAEAAVVRLEAGWGKCEILQRQAGHDGVTHAASRPRGQASGCSRLGASAGLTRQEREAGERGRQRAAEQRSCAGSA